MHVYMSVYLYLDTILLTHYLCHRSLFKTLLYLFLWKYLSRKVSDLSLHRVPFIDSSGPFLWPPGGLQRNAPACAVYGPHSFSWFQLLVCLRPTVLHQISLLIPCACLALPCSDGDEESHSDTSGKQPNLPPAAPAPCCPDEPGAEISAPCWQCQSSELARHSRVFWLKMGQDLIEMKIYFWTCRNSNQHWTLVFFLPFDGHYLKGVQNFWIFGVDGDSMM